ncbi:hybrid sensor histidine kinase/response regulator transcription factor [Spirosoma rhododendri]|uniref:histidine kinase n=1 Tax=Spirosoma rhododendri TaxID=2728024 RepID=A0A7L5DSA6_9BACT|nr:ATP-binding protein [Spirosoma rhododendri]QJD80502.1 response regulator [Spirosoma rhododendri]
MHKLRYWLWVMLVGLTMPVGFAATPVPEYLTVQNGLPQGYIGAMVQSRRGFMWFATHNGLCRYDGARFKVFHYEPLNDHSLSYSSIVDIQLDKAGWIWAQAENNRIDRFNPVSERAVRVSNNPLFQQITAGSPIAGISVDTANGAWIVTRAGLLFHLTATGQITHRQPMPGAGTNPVLIQSILTDRNGTVWLGGRAGLYHYVPATRQVRLFGVTNGLPDQPIQSIRQRSNGELIVGTAGQLHVVNPRLATARLLINLPGQGRLPLFAQGPAGKEYVDLNIFTDKTGLSPLPINAPQIPSAPVCMLVDRSNTLWIGTGGNGIVKLSLNPLPFTTRPSRSFALDWLTQQIKVPASAIPAAVAGQRPAGIRYHFDHQDALWLGGPQLPLYRYQSATQTFSPLPTKGIPDNWLVNGALHVQAITTDAAQNMWALTDAAGRRLIQYDRARNRFLAWPLLPDTYPVCDVTDMSVDGDHVYLATQNYGLVRVDRTAQRIIRWRENPLSPNALPIRFLLSLLQDPNQYDYLWVGTYGRGLCRLDKHTGQIRTFTAEQGLPDNVVHGIQADRAGHLWLSTNRGLCRFDTRSFEVRTYSGADGLPSDEFTRHQDIALPDGRLIFGGVGGYTSFMPNQIQDDPYAPAVALTGLRINNREVSPFNENSPIAAAADQLTSIQLSHRQNFLAFDFAALQYNQSGQNQFRYKLVGLDNDWVYSGNLSTATYTNLSPATYTFVVNASNTSGVWSPDTRQIRLIIQPAPWATWWAYTLYALLLILLVALFIRVRVRRVQLRSQVALREQESRQLQQIDQWRSRFFANITHEFRTPLTLILPPLELTLAEISDPQQRNRLTMVHRNATQLLRLINELLDIARMEAGNLRLTLTQANLIDFVEQIVAVFVDEAQRQSVRLRFESQLTRATYRFDPDKLEKIINNLLINALKFTSANGQIDVSLTHQSLLVTDPANATDSLVDYIRLTVSDTGKGIAPNDLSHIFERFYQSDATSDRPVGSSGIGLSYVSELVELMNGSIRVESQPGQGTTFTVDLPLEPATTSSPVEPQPADAAPLNDETDALSETDAQLGRVQILLVEDSDDIAGFVASVLNDEWSVRRARNGKEGIEMALRYGPNLVISDVLMPELDGYELCRQLKENPATSYIPILLLTAKSAAESRLQGLSAGADDYLTKPFQVDELRWRVRNRLEQQHRTRLHLRSQLLGEGHVPVASPEPADEFMNTVYGAIRDQLNDAKFGVGDLADAVGLSRMHLNRKLKTLTGLSPNELIRTVRLNRAGELLLEQTSVSSVAYAVGFDNPAYFSKVFKEHYGVTPSEFVEQHRPS